MFVHSVLACVAFANLVCHCPQGILIDRVVKLELLFPLKGKKKHRKSLGMYAKHSSHVVLSGLGPGQASA